MVRPHVVEEDRVVETWETMIEGAVYVWVYDRREDRYQKQGVGGRTGSRRLHITRDDRKYNQEQIPVENIKHDPFTNGSLRLVEAATRDDSLDMRYHLTNDDLGEYFELRDLDNFKEAIGALESELILRRLADLAEERGTVQQVTIVKDMLRERFPIGGSQRTVREMIAASERDGVLAY